MRLPNQILSSCHSKLCLSVFVLNGWLTTNLLQVRFECLVNHKLVTGHSDKIMWYFFPAFYIEQAARSFHAHILETHKAWTGVIILLPRTGTNQRATTVMRIGSPPFHEHGRLLKAQDAASFKNRKYTRTWCTNACIHTSIISVYWPKPLLQKPLKAY